MNQKRSPMTPREVVKMLRADGWEVKRKTGRSCPVCTSHEAGSRHCGYGSSSVSDWNASFDIQASRVGLVIPTNSKRYGNG